MSEGDKIVTNVMFGAVLKTEDEWKSCLSEKEYQILRLKATEKHHSGDYNNHYPTSGCYACKGCGFPLYSFSAKFDSGCGWPAYTRCYFTHKYKCHVAYEITKRKDDDTIQTEILCKFCSGHLGHLYYNEKSDGSERHCVNSLSVRYKEFPNESDDEKLKQEFGVKISDFQDGYITDESLDVVRNEFDEDSKLTNHEGRLIMEYEFSI